MTIEGAIKWYEKRLAVNKRFRLFGPENDAAQLAVEALREKLNRTQIWHDAASDPPPRNGLYYGARDDTISMWAVQYNDGTWTYDMYPNQRIQITRWAYWDAFN